MKERNPRLGILVALTYGLVIATTVLAAAAYFYFRSEIQPGESADPNPMRTMMVGAVWVPIYEAATYVEPSMVKEKEITTGGVKFRTGDPAGAVLGFYKESLEHAGFTVLSLGDAGGRVQAVRSAGTISVTVTATTSSENTTGEIRTLNREEPKAASPVR